MKELGPLVLPMDGKEGQPSWDGLAVDRDQLPEMLKYLGHLKSVHHTFELVSNIDRTCRIFPAPSDQEMLENFRQHRAQFKAIAEMAQADRNLRRIDEVSNYPEDNSNEGVSTRRAMEYRMLFDQVSVPRGIEVRSRGQFELLYWGFGAAVTEEFGKSYVHSQKPPKGLLKTTDGHEWEHRKAFEVYRHIEGDWYLFLSHLPR